MKDGHIEEEALEAKNVFDKTAADVPADAVRLKTVRNRAYTYLALAVAALLVFLAVTPQYWIGIVIALVLSVVVVLVTKNSPVIDIYEGFLVAHSPKDKDALCIIPNERLIYWTVDSRYNSIVELYFDDPDNPEQAFCAVVHSINSYQVVNTLEKYYHDKNYRELQRQKERRVYERRRREAQAKRGEKR